jgi:enoyl-CoA hydratase/carnithine racemase
MGTERDDLAMPVAVTVALNGEARAMVLTGADGAFTAGMVLKEFFRGADALS